MGLNVLDCRLRAEEVGLRLRHFCAVIGIVDLHQQIAGLHALEIVDRDPMYIPLDLGAERGDVAADVCVVCGLPDTAACPTVPLRRE